MDMNRLTSVYWLAQEKGDMLFDNSNCCHQWHGKVNPQVLLGLIANNNDCVIACVFIPSNIFGASPYVIENICVKKNGQGGLDNPC